MTAPAGGIAKAMSYARQSLASSSTFQALVDADDEAEALESIHYEGLPRPSNGQRYTISELQSYRPLAIVWTDAEEGYTLNNNGAVGGFAASGVILILIERDIPEALRSDHAEADWAWAITVGEIIDEIASVSGQATYLDCRDISLDSGPMRNPPDEHEYVGEKQEVVVRLTWGVG